MKFIWLTSLIVALLITSSVCQEHEFEERGLKHKGGGGGGYKGGGGGHKHKGGGGGYKPQKCHPQTITKYKTIYKDRKANVFNQVEILKPIPHVKKIRETRYTTIRYPVFITQVIKPLLTQVETKVKPVFFTKTINKYTTVLFTVTGIGQVTVTSVKYEKEYITRCMKKGGYGHGHHRRDYADEGPQVREHNIGLALETQYPGQPSRLPPPPGIPYNEEYPAGNIREGGEQRPIYLEPGPSPRIPGGHRERYQEDRYPERNPEDRYSERNQEDRYPARGGRPRERNQEERFDPRDRRRSPVFPPRSALGQLMSPFRRNVNRRGSVQESFDGVIGDVDDLYSGDLYYLGPQKRTGKKIEVFLEASSAPEPIVISQNHPILETQPLVIIT